MAGLQGGLRRGRRAAQHRQRGDEEVRRRWARPTGGRSCSSATTRRRSWRRASPVAARRVPDEGRHARPLHAQRAVRGPHLAERPAVRPGAACGCWARPTRPARWRRSPTTWASDVTVVDYDAAYVSEARFPTRERIVLPGGNFDALEDCTPAARGLRVRAHARPHVRPRRLRVGARRNHVHYVGMMGCAGKNDRVRELVLAAGRHRGRLGARQAPHRPEVRREDAGRTGDSHRRRTGGRALPTALQ